LLKFNFSSIISVPQHHYEKREGSGAGSGAGSTPLTNGSGSGRPKNIRIPNTVWS